MQHVLFRVVGHQVKQRRRYLRQVLQLLDHGSEGYCDKGAALARQDTSKSGTLAQGGRLAKPLTRMIDLPVDSANQRMNA